jgi:hypothetical protein
VATHPAYQQRVLDNSKETCADDRLPCRMDAAKKVIDELSEKEKAELELEIDVEHKDALEQYEATSKARVSALNVSEADQAV